MRISQHLSGSAALADQGSTVRLLEFCILRLASGWDCPGQRLSRARGNLCAGPLLLIGLHSRTWRRSRSDLTAKMLGQPFDVFEIVSEVLRILILSH